MAQEVRTRGGGARMGPAGCLCISQPLAIQIPGHMDHAAADTPGSALAAAMVSPDACTQSIRSRHNCFNLFMEHLIRGNLETGGHQAPDSRA